MNEYNNVKYVNASFIACSVHLRNKFEFWNVGIMNA